jgi:small subunit ribosomal protein S19
MTRSLWKGPFLENFILKQLNNVNSSHGKSIFIRSRNSIIFPSCVGLIFNVYNGKKFTSLVIKKNMVGLKFGEFVITRKLKNFKK